MELIPCPGSPSCCCVAMLRVLAALQSRAAAWVQHRAALLVPCRELQGPALCETRSCVTAQLSARVQAVLQACAAGKTKESPDGCLSAGEAALTSAFSDSEAPAPTQNSQPQPAGFFPSSAPAAAAGGVRAERCGECGRSRNAVEVRDGRCDGTARLCGCLQTLPCPPRSVCAPGAALTPLYCCNLLPCGRH